MGHRARGLQRGRRPPGSTSRTTTPARAPTGGARTGSPASATSSSGSASALALWNGRDPILKERIFGLTGNQGNHGEDAKEYWWYLDATPSHSWNRWRYHYPQGEFPYEELVEENARRGRLDPEYELLDTGAFDDDRYWIVEAHYAKADPFDVLLDGRGHERRSRRGDAARAPDRLVPEHVGLGGRRRARPSCARSATARGSRPSIPFLGALELVAGDGPDGAVPELLFCDNETNDERLFGDAGAARTRRTGSTTTSSPVPRHGQPRAARARRPRSTTGSPWRRARPSRCASGCAERVRPRPPWGDFADCRRPRGGARRTSSTRS